MIAFTLNPLVRDLTRLKVPRVLSVTIVYLLFVAAVAALLIAIALATEATRAAVRHRFG